MSQVTKIEMVDMIVTRNSKNESDSNDRNNNHDNSSNSTIVSGCRSSKTLSNLNPAPELEVYGNSTPTLPGASNPGRN